MFNISGVIYFEMCYCPFKTEMERYKVLENLRVKEIKMPDDFNKRSYIQLIRFLLSLLHAKIFYY